ncbi:hypothetical protein HBI32_236300 [Parastagonospora nodorum]|nr:hypothetical protein HBI32_236300 [Parastagonospora nodorum]
MLKATELPLGISTGDLPSSPPPTGRAVLRLAILVLTGTGGGGGGGGAQTPLSWSDRLLESIRDYCVARSRANSRSIGDG